MPNDSITDALKEVYALAPNDEVALDTIEISYTGLAETLYLVRDRISWDLTLEDLTTKTFKPCGFRFIAPAAGKNGFQQMSLAIDNVSEEVTDFFNALGTELTEPVKVIYRPYISTDTTQPQLDPPLELYLVDVQMTVFEVTGRATFTNIVNTKYPTQYYTAQRFPGLVGRGGNVIDPPPALSAWDIANLSFTNSGDIAPEVTANYIPTDLYVQPDGSRLFVAMKDNTAARAGRVQSYTFGTAWDITTLSPESVFVVTEDIEGVSFKTDGLKMYLSGTDGAGLSHTYEYDLSVAWDVTTAVFLQKEEFDDGALYVRADGEKILIGEGLDITSYDLSTAWDISTMVEDEVYTPDDGVVGLPPNSVFMRDDGSRIYWCSWTNAGGDKLYQSDLSIVWDLTTAVYNDVSLVIGIPDGAQLFVGPAAVHWKPDGLRVFVIRNDYPATEFEIYEYDIV